MDFTCIFFGILFTLAGLWFAFGKGYLHLSLWKNMPQKEKDKLRFISSSSVISKYSASFSKSSSGILPQYILQQFLHLLQS